jgi:uncharacterized membrane protein
MGQSDNGARDGGGLTDSLRSAASRSPVAGRLLQSAEDYLGARSEKLVSSLGEKVTGATHRLTDVANGNAEPSGLLGRAAKGVTEGESPGKAVVKGAAGSLKDKIKDKVKSLFGKGGSSGRKSMNIEETVDVGVPVREAYNFWTQYKDFPKWSKGVQSVSQDDETKAGWNAKIFLSKRQWTSKITEQIPDQRIQWTSDGSKGTVDGVVTFHELAPNLTRIMVALEYHPAGLFEKTGNLWRAQGRRVRLDLKLYRRYVMMAKEDVEGWRGEIRDGEVVRDHDEVVAEEERSGQQNGEDRSRRRNGDEGRPGRRNGADSDAEDEADQDYDETEDEADQDYDETEDEADQDYDETEDEAEDEAGEGEADEDYPEDEYDEDEDYADDEDYDEAEDSEEEEPPTRRRRAS